MGLFSSLFPKERALGAQPHRDWRWSLSVNGMPSAEFDWTDIARALDGLGPHEDSFVILEQKQGADYWFIQSAVALAGPHAGEYIVGVGWNDAKGKHLVERCGGAGKSKAHWACGTHRKSSRKRGKSSRFPKSSA